MKADPLHLNFYRNTGGYAWQVADFLQRRRDMARNRIQLCRAVPPRIRDPLTPYPLELSQSSTVRWANTACITNDMPCLIGHRGHRSSLAVSKDSEAFGEFDRKFADALAGEVTVALVSEISINGVRYENRSVLVSMIRHGLVVTSETISTEASGSFIREPTCVILETASIGWVAINQLNGRTIQLSVESREMLDRAEKPQSIDSSNSSYLLKFFESGLLRVLNRSELS